MASQPGAAPRPPGRLFRWTAAAALALGALVAGPPKARAQPVQETFATDPVAAGRFVQLTANTETTFVYNPATQNLTATVDVDASPAYLLSTPFAPVTDQTDASFSVRFRIENVVDQNNPAAFLGLLTDRHVGDFGDGLVLVLSLVNGSPVANADLENFDQSYTGPGVALSLGTDYLAVGGYRASSRLFVVEIFSGPAFASLVGYSSVTLPAGRSLSVNRVGMQNAGAREIDSAAGSMTLTVDDLFAPALNNHQINISDTAVTEGNIGTTNAVFALQLTPASGLPISVSYATANGTATAGQDYMAQNGVVTFAPGQTSATIAVPVLGDTIPEDNETFTVQLSNSPDATLVRTSATGKIIDDDGLPSLTIADASGFEGNGGSTNFAFVVSLSSASGQTISVNYATSDGTALQGSDYIATNGRLTFAPGETSKTVLVSVVGDTQPENDETFFVILSSPTQATLRKSQGVGTIYDDDSVPRLSIDDVSVAEGNSGLTPAVFTVSLTRPSTQPVSVDYSVASGTATVGTDLLAASGTITFDPGTTRRTITVSVAGDTLPEFDETYSVQLSNPVNATIAKGTGLGTIRNDDPFPDISVSDTQVVEGNSGLSAAAFQVQLAYPAGAPVSVNFSTSDGTALSPTDYLAQSGTITFPPGTTVQTVYVDVAGDTLYEADETFYLQLSGATLGAIGRGKAVATILNDDPMPVLTVNDVRLTEGNSGTTSANFVLSLSAPSARPVLVFYATADGTANANSDYVPAFGTITFPPGSTNQTISIAVKGDTLFEPDETFSLKLSNPVNATLARSEAVCLILNDDPAPGLSIDGVTVQETPGGTNALFTVRLSAPSPGAPVTVSFATADQTAAAGRNYLAVSGVLTFPPGVTETNVTVPVLDDGIHAGNETFVVNLTLPTNAVLTRAQGLGVIIDNDPLPTLSVADAQVLEGDQGTTSLVFAVSLDRPSGVPVTAAVNTRDGTATAVSGDYVPYSGQVHFDPGVTQAAVTVLVNGDLLPEPDETLFVDLAQVVNAREARVHATGTILDDDTRRLSVNDVSVKEGAAGTTTNAVFTVTLNKALDQPITVNFSTSDGTAHAGPDYFSASGTLMFAPGTTAMTVPVTVIGNDTYEPDKTFFLNLDSPVNAVLGRQPGVCTIINDDDALVISPAGMIVDGEDCLPANGAVDPGETVTVRFSLADTGTLPSALVTATLVSSPGITPLSATQTYGTLLPKGAPVARTFTFRADGDCGQTLAATLSIQNGGTNFGTVSFGFMLGTTVNGHPVCCNSADLALTAVPDAPNVLLNQNLTYTLHVTNAGPKAASDVSVTNLWRAPVTIVSAQSSQGLCTNLGPALVCQAGTIPAGGDVRIDLVVAPQQAGPLIAIFNARSPDNDPDPSNNTVTLATIVTPPAGLSINSVQAHEGGSAPVNAVFTVQLSPPAGVDVQVSYATTDGTAVAGQDYVATQGTLTIPANSSTASIAVPILDDNLVEPDETFTLTLSNPVNASLASGSAVGTATILDDDYPVLTVADVGVAAPSPGGSANAVFTLRLSAAPARPASISFFTSDGSAHAGTDYQAQSGTVAFTPSLTVTNIVVPITGNTNMSVDRVFYLNLTNAAGLNVPRLQAAATISSPGLLPAISIRGASVYEGPAHTTTNAVFQLALSRPSALPVQVDYSTQDGSAVGGSDYIISSGTATFAPGTTNMSIGVIINGDDTPEFDESFYLNLSRPVNATLARTQAQGMILNDDYLPQIRPAGTALILENCSPPNQAIDPLETVTVNFGLINRGIGPTTNLMAELMPTSDLFPLSDPQAYGALATNGVVAVRPFTFVMYGTCGQAFTATLQLRDGSQVVGSVPFQFTLGRQENGQFTCCTSADLAVSVVAAPNPVARLSSLAYIVTVTNRGPSPATGIVLTNRFSAPVQVLTGQTSQVSWPVPDLPPGQTVTVTNVVSPVALGTLLSLVVVSANQNDPAPGDNFAAVVTQVTPPSGVAIDDLSFPEGSADHLVPIPVLLWPPRSETVSVNYLLSDGTAKAGADYAPASGTLTFSPGVTNASLSVLIHGNLIDEPDKTFAVMLSRPVNAELVRSAATCTILNDDPPSLTMDALAVNVGTNTSTVALLKVTLSAPTQASVAVDYYTTNGTANAGTDYEAQRGTLTFPAGVTSQTVRIPIAGNTADEGVEHFYLQLLNPVNVTLARDQATITITDEAPVDLSVSDVTVTEGDSGFTPAVFSVTLRKPITHTVTVDYFTSDGTATAGNDYVPASGTLVFPPGTVQTNLAVSVIGNVLYQADRSFYLNLTNALNGVIRTPRGTGFILDDDPMPCLSILDLSAPEGDAGVKMVMVPVQLSAPSGLPVRLDVLRPACAGSPAADPVSLVFPPGQTQQTVPFPVTGNTVHEPNRVCVLQLANAGGATVCTGQAQLTIIDDDPVPGIEISDATPVLEGNSGTRPALFTVSLAGSTAQTVTVQFTTRDGTALAGTDYVAQSGVITFPPGVTSTNITVAIIGDLLVEPDESFYVTLSQPVNATLFRNEGLGTILNDDNAPQADCPSVVVLATPGNQTCFDPSAPITISAIPDRASDKVTRVEFYSGSTLLGISTSSPFQIVWGGAPVGDYCLTANVTCQSGQTVRSEPFCLGVTDTGAAIAIIRNFPDPEIDTVRQYLLEMGYCARVFDQDGIGGQDLSSYRLIIWDDLGSDGLTDATVQALNLSFQNNIPLLLIGDRLAAAAQGLTAASQSVWAQLLHLAPAGQTAIPGQIAFSTLTQDRQPGTILSGRYGAIDDFAYANSVATGQATPDATPLASSAGAALLVQFPNVDVPDEGQARSVSQTFRVTAGGDDTTLTARKALFENSVCWLLRCSYCPLVYLGLQTADAPASVKVGDVFTFSLVVGNNGECIASATIVTNQLPPGLGFVGAEYNQGISAEYNPANRNLVWRVGSVVSGSENNAVLTVTLRALQPGAAHYSACGVANYVRLSTSNCTGFDVEVDGTVPVPATLSLLRTTANTLRLRVEGQPGATYQVDRSSDLIHWLGWTNGLGPSFYIDLPETSSPTSRTSFYRAQ